MSIKEIRTNLPDYAKDIKINLGNILTEEESSGLSQKQLYAIALSCAYATKHQELIIAVNSDANDILSVNEINAAKSAATIMAMNNIYYRFIHLVSDKDYAKMPAGLRMNVIANPGVDKVEFELYSLAVSAINGCGMCIDSHVHQLVKSGVSKQAIQSTIKIAAVINATAQAMIIM